MIPPTNLLQYDAIFLAGDAADNQVLIDYVNAGGNIYLAGGTGIGGTAAEAAAEAARWNTFLNAFGLAFFGGGYNGITGAVPITSNHSIFSGVSTLYQESGNSVSTLDPSNPSVAILVSQGGQGLYGILSPERPTTVVGVVVDQTNIPVEGAVVRTVGNLSDITSSDGSFSIPNASSIVEEIVVNASAIIDDVFFSGRSSSVVAVSGGVTDVGTVTLREGVLVEDFEDGVLDQRISISTLRVPFFPNSNGGAGIKDVTNLGSTKAFGFGRSDCPASCFNNYTSTLKITLYQFFVIRGH